MPAACCWRADVDGFDNLSNETTLEPALRLSKAFRIPASLFVSARLCLNFEEWLHWGNRFPEKINGEVSLHRFKRWIRFLKGIEARQDLEYPLDDPRKQLAQVGSHMYYHYWSPYGYDASPETGWRRNVSPGQYHFEWESRPPEEKTVESEIIDNLSVNNQWIESFFGVRPTTWSAPADRPHPLYPHALDQVDMLGASESVERPSVLGRRVAPYRPDLGVSMPFHPDGRRVVETGAHTRRFDPFTFTQLRCLKRALRRAEAKGQQLTWLWHPHLRTYTPFFGPPSTLFFKDFLRFLVEEMGSTCWITTHHNIVLYWDRVLCPKHRVVHVRAEGNQLVVENKSDGYLKAIPVDVVYDGGKKFCWIVDLEPGCQRKIP